MGQINGDMIALMTFHKNLILEAFIPRILWQKKMKMIIITIIIIIIIIIVIIINDCQCTKYISIVKKNDHACYWFY